VGDGFVASKRAEIITFYSYKGGTGRSLALAHISNYLLSFDKTVVAIDLDLEAPGLAYKFGLLSQQDEIPVERGVLDIISVAGESGEIPADLSPFILTVAEKPNGGKILLLAAGNIYSADYWRKLAQLSWYDLFYGVEAYGVDIFGELIQRITDQFAPDYILIDSRTGITEVGGVATSVLADMVVCLFTNSVESRKGTREVLRSLSATRTEYSAGPRKVVPVLTRIPELRDEVERELLSSLRDFFNEPSAELRKTLDIDDIVVLHSDPTLQLRERLISSRGDVGVTEEAVLFRDYLRLFSKLVPTEDVLPHISRLLDGARERMLEDPDAAEQDLEALVQLYPHPESFRALLKFYRLRRSSAQAILRAAYRLWNVENNPKDPLIVDVVEKYFVAAATSRSPDSAIISLVQAVWMANNSQNTKIGILLARAGQVHGRSGPIARRLVEISATDADASDSFVLLFQAEPDAASTEVVQRLLERFPESDRLAAIVVNTLSGTPAESTLRVLFESGVLLLERLRRSDAVAYARALQLMTPEAVDDFLAEMLASTSGAYNTETWVEVGRVWAAVGKGRELEAQVRRRLPDDMVDEVLARLHEPIRRVRVPQRINPRFADA
jgi:hypothetical protein